MNAERWQDVRRLFEKVVALDPPERPRYLDEACANDADLRREVESLLAYQTRADGAFLETPAMALLHPTGSPETESLPEGRSGKRVGVYQIVNQVGHGGMGDVYRAVRADGQYKKEVAIKLVRGGVDSRTVHERFLNERQILASLDHPNIARLLDGGTTDDGVPYLVMELIEGMSIDQYSDAYRLNTTSRLQLFRQVCAAVQYAHQRLVIHRDIKPSNILVTDEGVPKLLDFGIAKILDPSTPAEVTLLRPMTPEYASPEQVRGEPITTATDVYSLGVVLYQLLTGHFPYAKENGTPHELARAICETEPPRPSTAVMMPAQDGQRVGAAATLTPEACSRPREGSPARLQRRLRGDLDNIVLKALRKEPQRRYASVEQLDQDLRRHLEGRPVTAVPDSFGYRARKFVQRYKLGVAAAALIVLTVAGGVAATVRQARIARAERQRAEQRFNDVRKLANSLIFEIHDSIQNLPGATPSRKLLLDRAVEYLDKLSQDAGGDVDLQRELAWAYQRLAAVQGDTSQSNLGQVSAAEVSIRKSIALFEAVAKANPANLTDQLNLAMSYRRRAFTDIYEPTGRQEIEQALEITEGLMKTEGMKPEVRAERSGELQILADVQDVLGERSKSIETFRTYLQLVQDLLNSNPEFKGIHWRVAKAKVMLGYEMGRFGARDEALQFLNSGIQEFEELVKKEGMPDAIRDLAASQLRRGQVQLMQGNPDAALSDFKTARASTARLAKLDPENTMLASDLFSLDFDEGRALVVKGDSIHGLALLQRSFDGFQKSQMEVNVGPGMGAIRAWIGETELRNGNAAAALKSLDWAVNKLGEEKYDDARCDVAMVQTKIANTLAKMGRLPEAEATYGKAIEKADVPSSAPHNNLPALYAAADGYTGLGDLAAARASKAKNAEQSRLLNQARMFYQQSLDIWKQISYPSRISGNGYMTIALPKEVSRRLANCEAELAQLKTTGRVDP